MEIPSFKFPNETFVHKETYIPNAFYLAQPVGKLSCIWFTQINNVPTCIMIDIRDRQLHKKTILSSLFDPELVGTILHGTHMYYESQPCFVIHNIFYYKHNPVETCYQEKYTLMQTIIEKYIWNEKMASSQCMFFMPVTSYRIENVEASYKIFCIKIIECTGNKIINYIDQTVLKQFLIQSTDIRDIYEVYTLENVYHSIAHVDTVKRSALLNKLFKKEITLDSIEESDDEEQFESKQIKMYCKWNEMMKKWVPIKV